MSRHGYQVAPYVNIITGSDHALGAFVDVIDMRYAGHQDDEQGEGYVMEWSSLFGISTNLIGVTEEDIKALRTEGATLPIIEKCNAFVATLAPRKRYSDKLPLTEQQIDEIFAKHPELYTIFMTDDGKYFDRFDDALKHEGASNGVIKNIHVVHRHDPQEDMGNPPTEPSYCSICNRVIPEDVPYCEVSDCPHKVYIDPQDPLGNVSVDEVEDGDIYPRYMDDPHYDDMQDIIRTSDSDKEEHPDEPDPDAHKREWEDDNWYCGGSF